jgi:hypothetical protein
MNAVANATSTRTARLDDYSAIAALQARNGLITRSYEMWSGLWTENPAALDFDDSFPLGWVLEDAAGELRGYLGNVPLAYTFRGRVVRAATPFSWVVDPGCRFLSLDLQRRFVRQKYLDLVVYTTPNAVTEALLLAFSFTRESTGKWDKAGFWITNYAGFARSAIQFLSLPEALSYPAAAALFAADRWRVPRRSSAELELCARFDGRFDAFWEELRAENREKLLAVRDRETLAWHFRRKKVWILAASRGTRMVAYAIFDRHDNPKLDLKRVRFVDFQALHGFEYLVRQALAWALDRCQREGIHIVENTGCWLERLGVKPPYRRRLESWTFYYKTRHPELSGADVWIPSGFDGDATI